MSALLIIPQAWVSGPETLPESWLREHAPGLCRVWPDAPEVVNRVASEVGVSAKLLVTRMQLEQGAVTYAWDGSSRDYASEGTPPNLPGIIRQPGSDAWKLHYLCGVDKTDSGPRKDGWFGPERQLYGCGCRFRFVYRGDGVPDSVLAVTGPIPKDLRGLGESDAYAPGVPVTRNGVTITPTNQASADCLRYTSSMEAQRRLSEIGRRWWPEDYAREETGGADVSEALKIVLDPGHGMLNSEGKRDTGTCAMHGVTENEANLEIALRMRDLLVAQGHTVWMTREKQDYTKRLTPGDRGRFSASKKADVFVSVHHDGSVNASANGCHGFYHDERAPNGMRLAKALAVALHEEFAPEGLAYSYGAPSSDWFGNELGVLKGGDNWAVTGAAALVECMFMSNAHDQNIIRATGYYDRAAEALCVGIYQYAGLPLPTDWAGADMPDEPSDPPTPKPEPTDWEKTLADAVAWAKGKGVSDGTRLGDSVTRGEVIVMLKRALGGA